MLGTIHKRCLPKGGGRGVQKKPKKETFTTLQSLTHCFVSSNSFHEQITQKAVHQITDSENKKCSH